MKLILISDTSDTEDEFPVLNQLFEMGLEYFHLRKPDFSVEELREYLKRIPSKFHDRIVLHSHVELINEFDLKGVHFNRQNKDNQTIADSVRIQQSASCHSYQEVEEIERNKPRYSYVFLSPIFDSISKLCYASDYEKDQLKSFLRLNHSVEIIALSGVDEARIEECHDLGFDGVAVLGAIWNQRNKTEAFIKLKETCQKYENTY